MSRQQFYNVFCFLALVLVTTGPAIAQKWSPLSSASGVGTAICNDSSNGHYACFALRCGKGRGLEFAYLFSGGDIEDGRQAQVFVDNEQLNTLKFKAIDPNSELVSAYDENAHGYLLSALQSGKTLELVFDGPNVFSLRNSSRQIKNTLRQCAGEIRNVNVEQTLLSNITGLSPQEKDTEQSYVKRIRNAAVPFGGACEVEQTVIERLQSSINVNVNNKKISTGETIKINWSGNTLKKKIPIYLMIATDAQVRFKGKGFYALMPNAIAPFGIKWEKAKTRAIIPLYGLTNSNNGTISIEPLLAGRTNVTWSVIAYLRKCQKIEMSKPKSVTLHIFPRGQPQIVGEVQATLKKPNRVFKSAKSKRLLEDYGNYFHLLNAETGSVIADGAGKSVLFSPTGRFFTAVGSNGPMVFDATNGQKLRIGKWKNGSFEKKHVGFDIGWMNNDSVLVSGLSGNGSLSIYFTLLEGTGFHLGSGCRACRGLTNNSVVIDLENNLFLGDGIGGPSLARLGGSPYIQKISSFTPDKRKLKRLNLKFDQTIRRVAVTSVIKPNLKTTVARVLFSNLQKPGTNQYPFKYQDWTNHSEVWNQQAGSSAYLQLKAGNTSRSTSWRGVEAGKKHKIQETRLLTRLHSIGFPEFNKEIESVLTLPASTEKDMAKIAKAIVADIPIMKGKFQKPFSASTACLTSDETKFVPIEFSFAKSYTVGDRRIWITGKNCVFGGSDTRFAIPSFTIFDSTLASGWSNIEDKDKITTGQLDCSSNWDCEFQVNLVHERYLIFTSLVAGAVEVYDIDKQKLVSRNHSLNRGELLSKIKLDTKTDKIIQINNDSSFLVYKFGDDLPVLEGRFVDDEIVLWTPSGHYDATAEGGHYVKVSFPGDLGQYSFHQFERIMRIPGLVGKVLNDEILPNIEVGIPPSISTAIKLSVSNRIVGKISSRSQTKIAQFNFYQDGFLTDRLTPLDDEIFAFDLPRLPGARWVSVIAVDEEGLVSLPVGLDMGADPVAKPKVRLLAVGIDKYNNNDIPDLRFAKSDANTLTRSLQESSGKSIDLATQTTLTNEAASPADILAAAEKLVADTKPGEQAVFFFAGHGVKGEDGRYYMGTSNTDPANISGTALSWDKLAAILAKSKARMSIFIDACHSGAAGTDFFATNDDAAAGMLKNIPSGLTVFSASKGRELSEESAQIGGGYFTMAIAEVIAGNRKKYDTNNNGVIEVSELYVGVKRQVTKNTNGRQTPWLARNQMIGDFALF